MAKTKGDSPLMQQHNAIKAKYPDAILLFRVGDFYETFGADAVKTASILGITLTKRHGGDPNSSELAGFPHHALDTYLHKLVKAGHRVAICDQLEDPKLAKGIVKRGVTELVTPGIATGDQLLQQDKNNFLCSMHFTDSKQQAAIGICFLDMSTGEFFIAEGDQDYCDKLLQSMQPAEVIFTKANQKKFKEEFGTGFFTYHLDEWIFNHDYAREILLKHFGTHSLKGFGIEDLDIGIVAAGAILHYLKDTEHPNLQHITAMQRINKAEHLWMDRFTIRNLELIGNGESPTLFSTINHTVSPMGARLLRRWMLMPLNDVAQINERLGAVKHFIIDQDGQQQIKKLLQATGDLERLISKVPLRKINPRELVQLGVALENCAALKKYLSACDNDYLLRLSIIINEITLIKDRIKQEIKENPPVSIAKAGVIADGVSEALDELRTLSTKGKEYLLAMQLRETAATGISSLKIGFNNVFGYYLEVTNVHKDKVPAEWTRKQTLTTAERYITAELKEYEDKILGAEEKILAIEQQRYESLLAALQDFIEPLQSNARVMAIVDCLCCFAANAVKLKYCEPTLHAGDELHLEKSRHPVIELQLPQGEDYISNDLLLNATDQQMIILTGPNMSGKSAILRQTALITLLAHMGSFVPAAAAKIPLTDKIFTRVGASDNISGGESTFMVEMNETASILNNLTPRSLIILDEIGRGTSTYDGISIAWSIAEFLHENDALPKTLFATHYHEMNELENKFSRIKNFHITNKELGNKIVFLRKLAPGGSTHSFGIHVAKMAGMPNKLIDRANEILEQLEEARSKGSANNIAEEVKKLNDPKVQLSIFDAYSLTFEEIRKLLNDIDINRLTPVEALLKLQEIKGKLG